MHGTPAGFKTRADGLVQMDFPGQDRVISGFSVNLSVHRVFFVDDGSDRGRPGEDETIAPGGVGGPAEAELIRGAQGGDRGRFEQLYRLHVGRVFGLCLRLSGCRDAAEEMTQEVFVKAWQNVARFRPNDGIAPWLKRVAINLHINELRKTSHRGKPAELPEDDLLRGSLSAVGVAGMDLETAISKLPPASRIAYVLHDVGGYKYREISRLTGTAVGTAKTHVHRARGRLKRMLGR